MVKNIFIGTVLLLSAATNAAYAQTVDEVKRAGKEYYWGEGTGKTTTLADKGALSMLISNISVTVKAESSQTTTSSQKTVSSQKTTKTEFGFTQEWHEMIDTYSNATIKNTERLTWGKEPNVHVFLFIKRSEVYKIFAERTQKIKEFTDIALRSDSKLQVADALRYYYWALMLLQSHPDRENMTMAINGENKKLSVFLPQRINTVFDNIKFEVVDKRRDENITHYTQKITYNNQLAANCDYKFNDGRNWSVVVAAKDGQGVVEMFGDEKQHHTLQVQVEYAFENEWKIDAEVYDVLREVDPVTFPRSYINVPLQARQTAAAPETHTTFVNVSKVGAVENSGQYLSLLERVEKAINTKDYESARNCFTPDGYDIFLKLVKYGNGKIIVKPNYEFLRFEDGILVRSLPMRFSFSGNRRVFVENVVFNISQKEKKIQNLSFGLSESACSDIWQHAQWNEYSRMAIINFIENYQTAYALKRLDYIESIFSDNALIIVGKVVKNNNTADNRFPMPDVIKRTQYTKVQYIRNLESVFRSNEYVNLKFTNVSVEKAGVGGEIYGIQLQQDYFSASYGDTGYLFLLADLNNSDKPVIHVRTWQEKKDPDIGVYGLSHF